MKITTEVEITEDRIANLLCSAFEGGSNYWTRELDHRPDRHPIVKDGAFPPSYLDLPAVLTHDGKADDEETTTIDLASIEAGLKAMAKDFPGHFSDFLDGSDDAETADVFLQCVVFGELVFG